VYFFCLQLDESPDVCAASQLLAFIWTVFNDGKIKEELLKTIRGEDTDLTVKLNELNTELQGENKTVIKMTGTTDSFKGKLKLW
jgi:hypothetical protein